MGADVKPDLQVIRNIAGETWTFKVFKSAKYDKLFPKTIGMAIYDHKKGERVLCFRSPVAKSTIAHEISHAIYSYFNFHRYRNMDNLEEKICDTAGKTYKRLFELTETLFEEFKGV